MDRYKPISNGADKLAMKTYNCGGFTVDGPGNGLGYHGYAAVPKFHFDDYYLVEIIARMMNIAFEQGILEQQRRTKEVLGL